MEGANDDRRASCAPEDARAALRRVLASPEFAASPRMGTFLKFLVDEWLAGRERSLKEYGIAVSVFGKDASFDPGGNAVVRVEAGRLRRLLADYARGSGKDEDPVLDIPKGSYVPRLLFRSGREGASPGADLAKVQPSRHHVTVVSCGLCGEDGGTGQSEQMHEVFSLFREHCARVAETYGGRLVDEGGDRFVAYFGWPQSLEHAAQRGVTAAVEIVSTLDRQPAFSRMAARAGVTTGWAVSGCAPNRATPTLLGDVVMTATTIFSHAPPKTVLISDGTRRLTLYTCRIDPSPLPVATGGSAWRVESVIPWGDAFPARDISPLIGREHELDLLRGRWSRVLLGEGQIAVVTGEPGVGKSRLVGELWAAVEPEGGERWLLRALPTDRGCTFAPLRKRLGEAAGITKDDDNAAILGKLTELLRQAGESSPLSQVLIESLFGFSRSRDLDAMPASSRKDMTLALLVRLAQATARRTPLMVVVEDAHWLDPSTREFICLFARSLLADKILLVVTTRPEAEVSVRRLPRATVLELSPLCPSESEQLIDGIIGPDAMTPERKRLIVEKAEGIPLFVEELAKTVGAPSSQIDEVPRTLIDLLMARLDRLGGNRIIAQIASVIGREFQGDFLATVLGLSQTAFESSIHQLIEDEIILPVGDDCSGFLCFRHILLRDAAYESILPGQKREYHERVARALADQQPFLVNRRPEIIASHLDKAGLAQESAPLWFEAGQLALCEFANEEALHHFDAGLKALDGIAPADRPKRLETDIVTALGMVIRITKGYGAPELYPLYKRARALCREFGTREQEAAAFAGCWTYLAGRGEWDEATTLALHCAKQAAKARNASLLLQARRMIGTSALYQGRLTAARHWLDKVLVLYDLRDYKPSHGYDAGAAAAAYSAWAVWLQGDNEGATARAEQGIAIAMAQNHAPSLAFALGWYIVLDILREDAEGAVAHGMRLGKLSREHGFAHWRPLADIAISWVEITRRGDFDRLPVISAAIDDFRRLWGGFLSPFLWSTVAKCHLRGDHGLGLSAIAEARSFATQQSEHLWDAEILRLSGEFALAQAHPDTETAIGFFRQAIAVAQAQGAVALERRTGERLAQVEALLPEASCR